MSFDENTQPKQPLFVQLFLSIVFVILVIGSVGFVSLLDSHLMEVPTGLRALITTIN
ncbi:hypothetical protein [Nitrosomonas ureae]|uniref:Uncharacterized protein n=1 Tax=Nitrosomonas ureae TaxID=44577 RepID=A0A2T5I640_9PROT|nr:hypothetical protein [Nitrosomonas ureae]PTQ79270.1 hypothetical protein C8R28_10532 [Nitrosomonas ureae]